MLPQRRRDAGRPFFGLPARPPGGGGGRPGRGWLCVSASLCPLFLASLWLPAFAQDEPLDDVRAGDGWRRQRFDNFRDLLHARKGAPYSPEKKALDERKLWDQGLFSSVRIDVVRRVAVVHVAEFDVVVALEIRGPTAYKTAEIEEKLYVRAGRHLDPALLRKDEEALTELYVPKGYAFFRVRREDRPEPGGVRVIWHLDEGPLVSVEAVEFTGNRGIDSSDLKRRIRTRENDTLLFFTTGRNPFVAKLLEEDVKWIQVAYWTEGWLDVMGERRVFVEDLVFNEAKTSVRIRFHVDEGPRYAVRGVRVTGNAVFPESEIRSWLATKPGGFYSERTAHLDVQKIREKYGERAYVLAEVEAERVVADDGPALDVVFRIRENERMTVGQIDIRGNPKTRDDVIRRELTRNGFVPGEEFDRSKLDRAVRRLRQTGWFGTEQDPLRGVKVHTKPGDGSNVQDVEIEVQEDPQKEEGRTGNVRFAAGYSSQYGPLGILEITQRNFDLGDLPTSLQDLFEGTGFAGGGQLLRLRLAPALHRQTGSLEFREPYFFGAELGFGLRVYHSETDRESWHERRTGGAVVFDKTVDPFRFEIAFGGYQLGITDLEDGTAASIAALEGTNLLLSITPAIVLDTRDHPMFPSEGVRAMISWEYAGQLLGGDFDFNKWTATVDAYWTVLTSASGLKHVLSVHGVLGYADLDPPFFERFSGGGRGSIRGFEFRGIGPREDGDPVGGRAYAFASAEYSVPLFTEHLRLAAFYDVANLTEDWVGLRETGWRQSVGFGVRFTIPGLLQIPVAIDFGFPLSRGDDDEEEMITIDLGKLF